MARQPLGRAGNQNAIGALAKIVRTGRRRFQIPPKNGRRRADAERIDAHFSGKYDGSQCGFLRMYHSQRHQLQQTA